MIRQSGVCGYCANEAIQHSLKYLFFDPIKGPATPE